MRKEVYTFKDGKTVTRVTHKVVRSGYNAFAQHVLTLENGDKIYIDYGDTNVTIESNNPKERKDNMGKYEQLKQAIEQRKHDIDEEVAKRGKLNTPIDMLGKQEALNDLAELIKHFDIMK